MSQRRMFSPKIVASDAFIDMPSSSRELYFQLGMYADDDGFVNPKRIVRMLGASEDDLKILIAKRFVLPFESGVVVIKHWAINNLIRKDWHHETLYTEEKKRLKIKENGSYTELVNELLPNSVTIREHSIVKSSIVKSSLNTMSEKSDAFDSFWNKYPKKEQKKKTMEIWNRKKLDVHLSKILDFIEKAKQTDRWKKGFIKMPTTFLNGECWNDDLTSYGDTGFSKSKTIIIR